MSFGHLLLEGRKELGRQIRLPESTNLFDHRKRNLGVPPDHSGVEQSERDAQVRLGNTEDLLRLPHRMIDLDALIPERIPQGFGNLLDVTPTLVDEQQIKVGVRAELASAVSADGDKSDLPG